MSNQDFKIPDCFDDNVRAFWASPNYVEKEDGHLYSNNKKVAVKLGERIRRKNPVYNGKDTSKELLYYINKFGDRARHWSMVYYMNSGIILYKTLDELPPVFANADESAVIP